MKRAFIWLLCGAPALGAQERLRIAQVELTGPLESVRLDLGAEGGTTYSTTLRAGETRTVEVPLPASTGAPDPIVTIAPPGAGSAHFAGWGPDEARRARWEALPPGLRARPRVMALPADIRIETAALLTAAALSLVAWSLRRKPAIAIAAVSAGSAGLLTFVLLSENPTRQVTVFEGDVGSPSWLMVQTRRDGWDRQAEALLQLEVEPARAFVWLHSIPPMLYYVLEAPGSVVSAISVFEDLQRSLTRAENRWDTFKRVWLRESDGTWTYHGYWELGAPLPPARHEQPSLPPGWIQPGLPQGTSVLIAELVDPEYRAERFEGAWVRLFGI